ncbi:MAG: hypothetical protein HQ501_00310 [Rhodospirillales bacterium]|nr:hypothetical protein [Rhodospirillales bacterium]
MRRNLVEIQYHPIRKNLALAPMEVFHARARSGETAMRTAERVLARRYRVRDYLIMDAETLSAWI